MNAPLQLSDAPRVELRSLDELWFQVSGTLCNLECTHCFISCRPHNDKFGYLSLETVERMLDESDRKSTRLNSSHIQKSRMPSSA